MKRFIQPSEDGSHFENAQIGEGTTIEPDVIVGFRYHPKCGGAQVGKYGILRKGTLIYGDVIIGDYFQSGHYCVIRAKVKIGDYCTLCNHSVLEGIIRMGNGVRIMSHTYVPTRTWIGDHVFIGPGVTFLNARHPGRSEVMEAPRGAFIEDEVMIGGGCTILPGVRIGERSFIAAGALVHKDVPPKSLAKGVPCEIEPLPKPLDRVNDRRLTIQPVDLWHPLTPDLASLDWPNDWPIRFNDG
jgi:acetyltransferase-like isoleucine patch superfamily enzyme